MGSCYSLPHKSHLKPPHPGKRAGKEAFLSRGFPSSAHTTSSSAWGVTKPIWKHHLCTCFQDSFVSTWSLSRRIRVHKSRATTSTLLSLLFKPFLEVPQFSSHGHLVSISWLSLCLSSAFEAWVPTEPPSPRQKPFCHTQLKAASPCCFFLAMVAVKLGV